MAYAPLLERRGMLYVPGLLLAAAIAAIALPCGDRFPLIGAPVFALAIGIALRSAAPLPDSTRPGLAFTSRAVLQAAIVVSGLTLSLATVIRTGMGTLPVTIATILAALAIGPLAGRILRLESVVATLISVGTAICGASAIGATAAVLEPTQAEVALAIAVIFCYNLVAVLAFPPIGHALHLTQQAFGIWAGTAVNDTSSVVATGYAYGAAAGREAIIVKLIRSVFILPIVAALAIARAARDRTAGVPVPWKRIIPWFICWFVLAALADSLGLVPPDWHAGIERSAVILIIMALAAIGLQTDVRAVVHAGPRPLLLGFTLWLAVAALSLTVQHLTGT
jgi:uncharacterized integral membrane protein (TIGR00698 family)